MVAKTALCFLLLALLISRLSSFTTLWSLLYSRTVAAMSPSTRCMVARARHIVPPLKESFHKVGVQSAGYHAQTMVIKSYSPNLMVHPYLRSSATDGPNPANITALAQPVIDFMPRVHVLVIGPGLGRDPVTQQVVMQIITEARKQDLPMVFDADALLIVQEHPDLVRGYRHCILTPNVVEFARLAKTMGVHPPQIGEGADEQDLARACRELSQALGGVAIIQKGKHDVISNGIVSVVCDVPGGLKRSGGQGDTLTGSLGTFLAWRKQYHAGLWGPTQPAPATDRSASQEEVDAELTTKDLKHRMSEETTLLVAAWAGSAITRECSRRAYAAKGRSLQASDLTDEVHEAFLSLIGEPEHVKI
ncbi:hypothetical protein KEM52_005283 [Ascosphaera acerosa]|nr:hypothetical protein KEM52_005283 [Ascosphaera acerosa]